MYNPLQLRFRGMGQNFEPIEATGGVISYATVDNVTYKIHKFTSGSSTFTITDVGNGVTAGKVEYVIVGGGGGTAGVRDDITVSGGGGAGGYRSNVSGEMSGGGNSAEPELKLAVGTYTVSVGSGGGGGSSRYTSPMASGGIGGDSSFAGIVSKGGGGSRYGYVGYSGGSGAGGGAGNTNWSPGSGTPNQGFNGGSGYRTSDSAGGGSGGGGGAGEVGQTTVRFQYTGSRGGNGIQSSITGTPTYYAGGGGGGGKNGGGSGGLGGGGNGAGGVGTGAAGANGFGGGGGGSSYWNTSRGSRSGASGGSGVVIIRYPYSYSAFEPMQASGGTISTYTQDNIEYTVHTFSSGSGIFKVNSLGSPNIIEYVIIGGGGAGGAADNEDEAGGGGGAGGFRSGAAILTEAKDYVVQVGAGGLGRGGSGNCVPGLPGGLSSFNGIEAAGGGGGLPPRSGDGGGIANGGSGGGGTERTAAIGYGNIPPTTPPQGYNGTIDYVDGPNNSSGYRTYGGGGGGATSAGINSSGGSGISTSIIDGTERTYAVGGDGGRSVYSGGASAPANTGNGGQGGRASGEGAGNPSQYMGPGGNGGSGIVMIRYISQRL